MSATTSTTGMKKTLGLTGVTMNAMALIAPGAFLWITYQLQAANLDSTGASTAPDMWTGIIGALIVAFLTAFAFAELARRYVFCRDARGGRGRVVYVHVGSIHCRHHSLLGRR